MDHEVSSKYVSSRTAVWCPVCGAAEGKGCIAVKKDSLRLANHNAVAMGTVLRPAPQPWDYEEPKKVPLNGPRFVPNRSVR
jgi:hypothetical protein